MSNIEKSEETTNIIGALKNFGGFYLGYVLILIIQLWLMNDTHRYNVLLMFCSIVIFYVLKAVFYIIPFLFIPYILYKIYKSIKHRNVKILSKGTFTIGAVIFILIVACFINPLIEYYFREHLFSRVEFFNMINNHFAG